MTFDRNILVLREYESVTIGPRWDPMNKIVPPSMVAELECLQADRGIELLSVFRRRVQARNFVGVVRVGAHAIEILPKTDLADDATRRRLVEMLSIAGTLPQLDCGIADLSVSTPCLLDAFMRAYTQQLTMEWHRGRIANYRRVDQNRSCLRGKLLFAEHFRRNQLRPERFFTRADQFLTDVCPSRLLKAGLDVCRQHGTSDQTRRDAAALLPEFDEVSNQAFTDADLDAIKTDRRIARFDPLLNLAKMFLRGRVPDRPGHAATYSLLFDMNSIFEQYIGRLVQRVCSSPLRVQMQVVQQSLVTKEGKRRFLLRPDIAVRKGSKIQCLIDTKWKRLDLQKAHQGVRQSDMYQAYAYAREYDCPVVVLLYPRFGELAPNVASYRLRSMNGLQPQIRIDTVDVSAPAHVVVNELKTLLASICGQDARQAP